MNDAVQLTLDAVPAPVDVDAFTIAGMVVSGATVRYLRDGVYPNDIAEDCRAVAALDYLCQCCGALCQVYEIEIGVLGSLMRGWELLKQQFLIALYMHIAGKLTAMYRERGTPLADMIRIQQALSERALTDVVPASVPSAFGVDLDAPIEREVLAGLRERIQQARERNNHGGQR